MLTLGGMLTLDGIHCSLVSPNQMMVESSDGDACRLL